ncbi:thiamine pyrophosphate-dependent enzyme [Paenibacillus sp. CN-4]|uniref:thiamine pyrophosphate-dependent enzyme n=1 Tax=Paenibacillus nanchangensis TaxID=3348343 RepID=UPI00397E8804
MQSERSSAARIDEQPVRLSGAEILLHAVVEAQVECLFSASAVPDFLTRILHDSHPKLRWICTRHGQGAIHAADGYARATGKTGVCFGSAGYGATDLVTGIATAFMDSAPLVIITVNVPLGQDATGKATDQDFADIAGIVQPVTKHSYFVHRIEVLAGTLAEAFYLASTGRKGPVHIDIPADILAAEALYTVPEISETPKLPKHAPVPGYSPLPEPDQTAVRRLGEALLQAEKPLILAGAGVLHAGAHEELAELAHLLRLPVTTTLLGLGVFPPDDELWLGMPGMHGTYAANQALIRCDLLVSLGARFDDRVTMRLDGFAPDAIIAHVDIDPAEIGKLVPTQLPVCGDARVVLRMLIEEVQALMQVRLNEPEASEEANDSEKADKEKTGSAQRHTTCKEPWYRTNAWLRELSAFRTAHPLAYDRNANKLKPQYVIELISRTTQGQAIVTTDVGQHQMWAAQFTAVTAPRRFITSGGLGTMGFGLPSAIGAQAGCPDRIVVSVNGDGGMQMCAQELAVCAELGLPVKVVVLNNQTLGMIRQWQDLIYEGRRSHIDLAGSPDFVKLAEAYGIPGLRADSSKAAEAMWNKALNIPGPVLIDFMIDPGELVLPMVHQGKSLSDMMLWEEQ